MKELTLEEIHQGTLEILKKIIAICDELGINYFLAYGTLLGAVRHQGFIPWDDDLDVTMLRPEFDKFEAYCMENAQALMPYCLISGKNRKDYSYGIPRFCDTRYRMEMDKISDAGMGMFVDVYPLDGLGDAFFADGGKTEARLTRHKIRMMTGAELANHKKFLPSPKGFPRTVAKAAYYAYAKLRGANYFLDKLNAMSKLYPIDQCRYVGMCVWDLHFRPLEKWHYEDFEYLTFEGIQVKAPAGYKEILTDRYGDYMQLPPEEKRKPQHGYRLYRKEGAFDEE